MRIALAAALAFALTGCALLDKIAPPPKETPVPAPRVAASTPTHISPAEELVAYLARLKSLNESALNAEASRQRQAAQRDSSEVAKIKAAMAMTIAAQVEETDILAIVDPLAKNSRGDADVRAMASFLQGIAQERRRLKESAAAAGTRLRDAQRARDTEKQRADALQERAAQLQQKLDALTELEKSLSDRQSPPR